MQRSCHQCAVPFDVTNDDLAFLEKVSPVFQGKKENIPPPALCPPCRAQRRLAFRNERAFYHRTSDLSGKRILSVYSPDKPHRVYDQKEWWSDAWDPLVYGRTVDFTQPFFPQFTALHHVVPQMNLINEGNENAEYCHLTAQNRNCYLIIESSNNEDCLFGYWIQKCKNCCDVSFSHACERCAACDNCYSCYDLRWSRNCTNCISSAFLFDCIGCRNCFSCTNLRQKEYCVHNEQCTKEEYEQRLREYTFGSSEALQTMQEAFEIFRLQFPHRATFTVNAEHCSGDYIRDSKNCFQCYHAYDAEDCRYAEHVWRGARDCMDVSTAGIGADHLYESINIGLSNSSVLFSIQCWSSSSDLLFCYGCFSCAQCCGCVGLRHKRHCILNRQYTEEEYNRLVPQLIAHMRTTGEWGEFFPPSISPFGYNETVAQEQYPLAREEVQAKGWTWHEEEQLPSPEEQVMDIPDDIRNVSDDIYGNVLRCAVTGKPYKILPQELAFYREMNIPLPRKCPDQRHRERMAFRNPHTLWSRTCAKCGAAIQTTYAPERPEIVYCEECYLQTVY